MNNLLIENNYIAIPRFITPEKSTSLAKEFKTFCEENNIWGDDQVSKSSAYYNYLPFLEILCEKTLEVSTILEEKVLPTYSYARVYNRGSILKSHVDRNECEISLTVHLDGDLPWKFYITKPNDEVSSVILNPGDALMYLGNSAIHWRNEYQGEWYAQTFFHYVVSNGNYSNLYFDRLNPVNNNLNKDTKLDGILKSEDVSNKNILNICDNANIVNEIINQIPNISKDHIRVSNLDEKYLDDQEIKTEKIDNTNDNTLKTEEKKSYLSQNKLEDYIMILPDIFDKNLCNQIVNEYKNSNEWVKSLVAGGIDNYRSSSEIFLSKFDINDPRYEFKKFLDQEIHSNVHELVSIYMQKFPLCVVSEDSGYTLLKYEYNQFYKQHTDSYLEKPRGISCSIVLNEDYDGGEFCFFDKEIMIKPSLGSAILFPSNFMYPHEICPVTKNTRYSIVTWLS